MKDLNISEGYYLSLKPEIAKIILEDLTDSKEINDQNNKIKFILEELNMINSSLQEHHKKKIILIIYLIMNTLKKLIK